MRALYLKEENPILRREHKFILRPARAHNPEVGGMGGNGREDSEFRAGASAGSEGTSRQARLCSAI